MHMYEPKCISHKEDCNPNQSKIHRHDKSSICSWACHKGCSWACHKGCSWACYKGCSWACHKGCSWAWHKGCLHESVKLTLALTNDCVVLIVNEDN